MTVTIVNEGSISKDLKKFVGVRRVWINNYLKEYVYKKTLTKKEREDIIGTIKQYHSSSKGKDIPSDEMSEDIKNSTRQEIEILHQNPKVKDFGFLEQYEITLRKYFLKTPLYNKRTNNGPKKEGYWTEDDMKSFIAKKRLKDEFIRQQKEKENDKITEPHFNEGFVERDKIKLLKEKDKFIQGRRSVRRKKSVSRYTRKMKEDANPNNWKGRLIIYLPEDIETLWIKDNLPDVGDGNQSSDSCLAVPKMSGLKSIEVPYDWHKYIKYEDKEALGTWYNRKPMDSGDWAEDEDIEFNIENTLRTKGLISKNGVPDLEHQSINEIFDGHALTPEEIKTIKSRIRTKYKNEIKIEKKKLDNSYDFSDEALDKTKNTFLPEDKKAFDKIKEKEEKIFPDAELVKKVKYNVIKEKLNGYMIDYMKENDRLPKKALFFVWFDFTATYEKYKNSKDIMKGFRILSRFSWTSCNIKIVFVNPAKPKK